MFDISELNDNDNEESEPERWDGDAGETEDEVKPGDYGEPEEPEPQEEEHLLHRSKIVNNREKSHLFIDNVERENTKTVELLLPSSGAHRVEGAAVKNVNISKV